MITTYFRSSSFNQWDYCEQSYFLAYILGLPQKSNKKAEMGTVVHKVMENLAAAKKALQDGKDSFIDHEISGEIHIKHDMVYSDGFVEYLFAQSYNHYTSRSEHEYTEKDRLTMLNWTFKPLRMLNGSFDPRNRDIVAPELHFDFEIEEEWAKYTFELPDGQKIEGNLALKGTIDLVTRVGDNIYESIDWKTGQRLDWASNRPWPHNIKTYEKLTKDNQLRIYHYALHKSFPEIDQLIPTIVFINDHGTRTRPVTGGIFSMAFDKDEIEKTKECIRRRFEVIKNTIRPHLNKGWKCTTLCHFGKNAHASGEINPRTGQPYTICEYISKRNREVGMQRVLAEEKNPNHSVHFYKAPGT